MANETATNIVKRPLVNVHKDYKDFLAKIGFGKIDEVDVTNDGYPLSVKEATFIATFVGNGNLVKSLQECGLSMSDIAGKDYIADEIKYRLDTVKKESIADADEILQYFTAVMRGEVKDQFGLDAPLCERTAAAKELAKRVIDITPDASLNPPTIKVTFDWGQME